MNIFKITLNYDDGTTEERTLDVGCSIEELRDILMQTVPGIESVDIQAPERWREIEVSYLVDMIDELEEAIDTVEGANHGGCDDDYRNSYPYAAGFAGAAMKNVMSKLEAYL
jgi:hypothetical protein